MSRRSGLFLLGAALSLCGCFVFDPALYQKDATDAAVPEVDGGPPPLALADDCVGDVPVLALEAGQASSFRAIDTTALSDNYYDLSCTGRPGRGPDGFFAVDVRKGERWHFHVRRRGEGADPIIFMLRNSCGDVFCDRGFAVDSCRTDSDEHLSIVASSDARYFIGIDSGNSEGFVGSVEVFRPMCGDGVQSHGETCEPPEEGCTSDCRQTLMSGASEREVNDDAFMANILSMQPAERLHIGGRVGPRCENDVYAIDVPEGGYSLRAAIRTASDLECGEGTPPTQLQLLAADGVVVLGEGTIVSGTCPQIDGTQDFARNLVAGRYYLRVYSLNEEVSRPFDYQLEVAFEPGGVF